MNVSPRIRSLLDSGILDDETTNELRALLAVARAARILRERVADVAREARNTHQDELDGDRIGRLIENAVEDADRALARLDRAGGG